MTSDGGLLAYRELDDALGLFNSASTLQKVKIGLRSNGILAILFHKVDMGNIYSHYKIIIPAYREGEGDIGLVYNEKKIEKEFVKQIE